MELIVNKFGARIKKKYERIVVYFPLTKVAKEYPIRSLSKIVIMGPASISSGAVQLALEYDVDIVYLSMRGMPYGRIYSSKPGRLTEIKRKQIEATASDKATYICRNIILGKIRNQQHFLGHLAAEREYEFVEDIERIESIVRLLNLVEGPIKHSRKQLFGIEGQAADRYFRALRRIIQFPGRRPQGGDVFNMALNYGYGILYNEIERNCILTGLDPFIGFLHTERYGKISLVFDLIEEWRVPIVDSMIIPLFLNTELADSVEYLDTQKLLSKAARTKIIRAVFDRLHSKTRYQSRNMQMATAMKHHIRSFAHYLIGKKRSYKPFVYDFNNPRS